MPKSRKLTVEEAQEKLLVKLWECVDYWDNQPNVSQRHRLEGLLHTILASGIDGCGIDVPTMEIRPIVSKEDIKYLKKNEENWWPAKTDIGGLHELMYPVARKHKFKISV